MQVSWLGLLALLFIGLKLAGCITWSWWWVLSPLWGGVAILLAILLVIFILAIVFGDLIDLADRK